MDHFRLKQRGMQNAKLFRALRENTKQGMRKTKAVVTGARFCTRWRHEPNQTDARTIIQS